MIGDVTLPQPFSPSNLVAGEAKKLAKQRGNDLKDDNVSFIGSRILDCRLMDQDHCMFFRDGINFLLQSIICLLKDGVHRLTEPYYGLQSIIDLRIVHDWPAQGL